MLFKATNDHAMYRYVHTKKIKYTQKNNNTSSKRAVMKNI